MKIIKRMIKLLFLLFFILSIFIKFNTVKVYLKEEPSVHLLLSTQLYKNYKFSFFSGYGLKKITNNEFENLCNQSIYIIGGEHDFLGEFFYDYIVCIGWLINLLFIMVFIGVRIIRKRKNI